MLFSYARNKQVIPGDNSAHNATTPTMLGRPDETMDTVPFNTEETAALGSYAAAVTLVLFSDSQDLVQPTRKRPPSSPVKDENPAAKKTSVSEKIASFEKAFLQASKEQGPVRTKLMQQMDGKRFYTLRSLYLQHLLGKLQDADPRKVSQNNINDKEKEKWQALKGTLKPDAFTRLMTVCEDLRREQPDCSCTKRMEPNTL